MKIILIMLSILWIALGTAIVLYTSQSKSFLREFILGMNIRLWALAPLAVGLLFVVGAFMLPEIFWIALILGILAISKGAYFALGPLPQVNSIVRWWFDNTSETTMRLSGLILFTFGVVLLSRLM